MAAKTSAAGREEVALPLLWIAWDPAAHWIGPNRVSHPSPRLSVTPRPLRPPALPASPSHLLNLLPQPAAVGLCTPVTSSGKPFWAPPLLSTWYMTSPRLSVMELTAGSFPEERPDWWGGEGGGEVVTSVGINGLWRRLGRTGASQLPGVVQAGKVSERECPGAGDCELKAGVA